MEFNQNRQGRLMKGSIAARVFRLLVAAQLLLPFTFFAQKARFEFFSPAEGLAGNNTATVAQDDQGFLWFINDNKLHRYDGRNFITLPPPDELLHSQDPFLGLAACQDSLLFLWTEKAAFLLHPKTGIWQKINIKEVNGQTNPRQLYQRMGQNHILLTRVLMGFSEADVLHFRNGQLEPVPFPKNVSSLNTSYFWCDIDTSGYTCLAYQDTFYQLDAAGRVLAFTPMDNIGTNCVNLCFQFGSDGTLVLLANWRFYVLDKNNNRFVPHPANRFLKKGSNHLHRLLLEKDGSIWACGADRNLVYYDAPNDTLYNFHEELKALLPNQNDFKGVFQDKSGIVWVDTRMGLLKVKPQIYPFDKYFDGLNSSNAFYSFRGFAEDAQGMIYGMYYDGIARFDPARKQPARFFALKGNSNVFDLHSEGDMVWVNGGQLLDPKSNRLINVPSPFHEISVGDTGFFAMDQQGTLWWAAHYYLLSLNRSAPGFRWTKAVDIPEKVYNKTEALHAGRKSGTVWLSFKGKLLQFDPKTKAQRWFEPANLGLPFARIMVIEEDRTGKLWLGTDEGLVRFDPEKNTAVQYTVNDGLPNNFICGMLAEGDSGLWLSTNHGLSRFDMPTATFANFLAEDGLTHNEFNRKSYYKARNGRMFFGGMQGVNAFFPEKVMQIYQKKTMGAKMVLSALEYTDERVDSVLRKTHFGVIPEIHFRHWDWSYTFEYALTDFSNPEEILYSYQMEGYKDGWSTPSRFNFTRFNSLPSGAYIFRVKARDSRGRWHPDQLAVRVVVHPPWWATIWAYLLYAAALFAVIYYLRRYELHRQRLQIKLDLEKREAERLKDLDQFKTRLYTNLTHEFRTPLTVILGMVGQIRNNPKRYLEEGTRLIENNGKNLLRLVNQLLDLSRLENQSFPLHLHQGDIVPYLRYVTESFQTYANSNNLSLRFFSTLQALVMDYDPEQIKQVLTNLISNGLKFTPSGGEVSVIVDASERPTGNTLLLTVRDTGIGISKEDKHQIFDRFYQVDSSTTRQGEGTGIGLAHTQELVRLMGGQITVESEPGKGSRFIVALPIRREAEPVAAAENMETAKAASPHGGIPLASVSNNPDRPQLLLIEDNPDVVVYLKSCLTDQYQVDVAYNGRIGIEKALEQVPDLIISDVMMPEKDGFEVCDTLKNDERTSHIPIILLTAKADNASRIAGLRRGADAYLSKPFDREELLVRLEVLVERQKRMAAWFSKTIKGENASPVQDAPTREAIQMEDSFIRKVRAIVEANYADEDFGLTELCRELRMSRSQIFRKMTALINTSPSDFIRSYRLDKARTLLATTDLNVSEVAWQVGYKDLAHFSRSYQEAFGEPPSTTKK